MALMRLDAACPACRKQGLIYNSVQHEIAYFGDTLETIVLCEACGFRHADLLILREKEPARYTLQVDTAQDLWARVVRGTAGTIRIPELGVLIEPGPASESFVSNVEGVLVRVERVLGQLHRDAEDPAELKRIEERRGLVQRAMDGAFSFTIVIEDPYGNSAIIHDNVKKETPTEEEIRHMATGMTVFDIAQLPPTADPKDLPLSEIPALRSEDEERQRRKADRLRDKA